MNREVERYLEIVEKHLRMLTIAERIDIVSEIKSHILEMLRQPDMTTEKVLDNLGNPKDLARSYISETIMKNPSMNFRRMLRIIAFYGKTGLSGMFIVPCTALISVVFYFSAFIIPIGGLLKTGGYLLGYDVGFIMFQFGSWNLPAMLALPVAIPFGFLFYFLASRLWKFLKKYISSVSASYAKLDALL